MYSVLVPPTPVIVLRAICSSVETEGTPVVVQQLISPAPAAAVTVAFFAVDDLFAALASKCADALLRASWHSAKPPYASAQLGRLRLWTALDAGRSGKRGLK